MEDIKSPNSHDQGMKSWRLVVRNLPFDTKREDLEGLFAKYGEIKEINLPKCKDARFPNSCAGFSFIQYGKKKSAEYARLGINGAELKGRKLGVEWSVDKDSFVTKKLEGGNERKQMETKLKKILFGDDDDENVADRSKNRKKPSATTKFTKEKKAKEVKKEVKVETDDDDDYETAPEDVEMDDSTVKSEIMEDSDDSGVSDDESENLENDTDISDSDVSTASDESEKTKRLRKKAAKGDKSVKKAKPERKEDVAVLEGRVVFLRNIDFGATNESVKEAAEAFGAVSLAIMCKYPGTDQPCGTGFVHFVEKESADAFLNQVCKTDGVLINGRQVYGHRAVPRANAAAEFAQDKKKQPKDKRNLHLLRASLIREGTAAAHGMSETDAELRKRLAVVAKNRLKDLTMFVSATRLAIHNIPFTMNDDKLRDLCFKAAKNAKAKIVEARIMRETVGKDEKGRAKLGKSKGYGFVAFSDHADALNCLRNLNNNGETFTPERRPVVEFSIENLNALRAKERRVQDFQQRLQHGSSNGEALGTRPTLTANGGDPSANFRPRNGRKPKFAKSSAAATTEPNDPAALAETKRELMAGGQKWMPKRLGEKVRHRDLKKRGDSKGGGKKIAGKRPHSAEPNLKRAGSRRASTSSGGGPPRTKQKRVNSSGGGVKKMSEGSLLSFKRRGNDIEIC